MARAPLKLEIITCHKNEITNESSFKYKDGSRVLKNFRVIFQMLESQLYPNGIETILVGHLLLFNHPIITVEDD